MLWCKLFGLFVLAVISCSHTHAFIVPQEVPSLLSLIYSFVPQIKKGTDSRLGFGFRLGEHADAQVILEIGPQTNTRPIGNEASGDTKKRNVDPKDYKPPKKVKISTPGSSWLSNWSTKMKYAGGEDDPERPVKYNPKPIIADAALKQLQQLYGPVTDAVDGVGTLPAAILDTFKPMPASLDSPAPLPFDQKFGAENLPLPFDQQRNYVTRVPVDASTGTPVEKRRITAELMDVDFD